MFKKERISVVAVFDEKGMIRPYRFKMEDDTVCKIDEILKVRRAASTKVGGVGLRYTCRIGNIIANLFLEETTWFLEREIL